MQIISTPETLRQYYYRTNQPLPPELQGRDENVSHFTIKQRTSAIRITPYNRRDYYKVCLIIGTGLYRCNNKEYLVEKAALVFTSPLQASQWESLSVDQDGYYCLFNDSFLLNSIRPDIKHASALFNPAIEPIIMLDDEATKQFRTYFAHLEQLHIGDYTWKYDMIKHALQLLIHEGIRLQQSTQITAKPLDRVVTNFLDMLDRQFPVDSPENPLRLMTPADFATQLHVHVNYLNAMVKKSTGKTTREMIQEKIIDEAKKLLHNTNWDAAEIAYSLGFEYPSHFNKYFKQHTGITPLAFRKESETGVPTHI